MTNQEPPEGRLSHLHRTDGSSTFSYGGYNVMASVNGPIEAQRRDENPFEAVLDVVVRPASGVGGTRERHLEAMLQAALRQLVLVKEWPRCVIQITLQIVQNPINDYVNSKVVQAQSNLLIFPPLFHAAQLALLSGAVAMRSVAISAVVAVPHDSAGPAAVGNPPSLLAANEAKSLHLLGFTLKGALVLAESEGNFTAADWDSAVDMAKKACLSHIDSKTGQKIGDGSGEVVGVAHFLRSLTEVKVASDLNWR